VKRDASAVPTAANAPKTAARQLTMEKVTEDGETRRLARLHLDKDSDPDGSTRRTYIFSWLEV